MKCTKCGKEMTIRPVQTGTDEAGEPVFTRYAFCYDCRIKVNLDKKKERAQSGKKTVGRVEETQTKVKRKKKKGRKLPSISLPKRKGGRGRSKPKKEKRGGGFLKFLFLLVLIAALGAVGYTYRRPIAEFAQQMYEKYTDKKGEEQTSEPQNGDENGNQDDSDITVQPNDVKPQDEDEPSDHAVKENGDSVPENDGTQDSSGTPTDENVTEP